MKRVLLSRSFDPIMLGHFDIICRALALFDGIVVAIGVNGDKSYMLTVEQRRELMEKVFTDEPEAKVSTYQGLTVDYCRETDVQFILRGLRSSADLGFEKAIAHTNRTLFKIETVSLLTVACTSLISSSTARDIIRNNGDYTVLVSESVKV